MFSPKLDGESWDQEEQREIHKRGARLALKSGKGEGRNGKHAVFRCRQDMRMERCLCERSARNRHELFLFLSMALLTPSPTRVENYPFVPFSSSILPSPHSRKERAE